MRIDTFAGLDLGKTSTTATQVALLDRGGAGRGI